ncbi:ShlB/FhaC/HecB family hemolysin secretion/activation protein [Nostoc punctiforme UO1]|uniref:ShlB/FhaC/HecB family hemolysin secretion/activation protein n=1 Tax=Nostoc punctiforme TaxID=272131 RepID=UPI0030984945
MSNKLPKKLTFSWLHVSIIILLSCITSRPVYAQVVYITQLPNSNSLPTQRLPPPQDIQPPSSSPSSPPQPLQLLPSPAEILPPSELTPLPDELVPSNASPTITVEHFEIVGNTVFTPQELAQAVAEFTNRPISLLELYQVRSKITDLYVQRGYITSGAYIPPQEIRPGLGVVKIQVVEGKFEEIQINGTRRLSQNYIRSRIEAGTSGPVNRQRLLEVLQVLQLNPLIETVSAELSTGEHSGTSVLTVNIKEAKTFSTQIVLDNGRSPAVGSFRRRLQVNEANLLGMGDSLAIVYTNTDGSNSFDTSYTLPLNRRNGTLLFSYGINRSDVIERPFNVLDIQSDARYYELTYRQPVIQTSTQEFALGLTASRRESEASYVDFERIPFPSLGADENGETRVSALRFFQEWVYRNNRQVLALRSQFSLGLGAFDATINQESPDSRFFSWLWQAQWVRLLAPETLALLRLNTQLTSTSLVPLEQFGVGGQESVRGYRQDFLLTDNGVFASAEVQVPILRAGGTLQMIPFADFGIGWNAGTQNPDSNTLASVGLGLQWRGGDHFNARVDWGIPLMSVDSNGRTWQDNGVYFSVQYNAF